MTAEEFKRLAKAGQLPGQTLTPKNIPTATAPTATMTPLQQANSNRQMRSDIKTSVPGATTTADAMRTINSQNIAPTANVSNAITALGGTVNYAKPKDTILANNNKSYDAEETTANTSNIQKETVPVDVEKNMSKEDKEYFLKLDYFNKWLQDNIISDYKVKNANQGLQNSMQGYDKSIEGFRSDYSLENDPNYQAIADYNRRIMLQDFNKRGMALSDNTFAQIEQAQALLGRDFMNDEYARRQQDINNRYGQVGVYNNLNNQNYNMDMQGFNTAQGMEQQSYNRGIDTLNREIANYGFELTPQTRELMNVAQSMTPEQRQYAQQFEGNFAEEMGNHEPNSPEYKALNALRFNKSMQNFSSEPQLYGKYLMNDYGLNPMQVSTIARQQGIDNLEIEKSTIGQYYNDFQAEINKRMGQNPNDPMIPYLQIARNEKISAMNKAELNQFEKMTKDAMDLWKISGVADSFISEALGIPVGAMTADYYDKMGRLSISEFSAQSGRISANASAQNAALNKQKFEMQDNIGENVTSFVSEYLRMSQGQKNYTVADFLNTVVAQDEAYLESGGTQGSFTYVEMFNTGVEYKQFLDVMSSLNRIDSSEYNQYMFMRDALDLKNN